MVLRVHYMGISRYSPDIFLNWIISIIHGAKFGAHVVEDHSEETFSQNFYLGLSFYFMNSRKSSCKKL